jgi:hypothetical protein
MSAPSLDSTERLRARVRAAAVELARFKAPDEAIDVWPNGCGVNVANDYGDEWQHATRDDGRWFCAFFARADRGVVTSWACLRGEGATIHEARESLAPVED